uniref:Uncharacterized protein n=1 Tax=Siphoviridae sp. ctSqC25 TaxID=2823582 RepID=A0A8S5L653_9CAUD|nr:MAG TPA: hypothetical protein [Siphoviridae sp. ctSqC25]
MESTVIFPPFRGVAPQYQKSAVRAKKRRLSILIFTFQNITD